MAGQSKKATKKFEKNHLKDTIDRRKEGKKIKQRQQVKAKKRAKNTKENENAPEVDEPSARNKLPAKPNDDNPFGDMSVDDFFRGGFDIPGLPAKERKASKVNNAARTTRKRKRTDLEDENGDLFSDGSIEANAVKTDSEPEESEVDDVDDAHKGELDALADKDPEFYKFLQENDAELLDFDETGNLEEVDALSGSDDDLTRKKKRKKSKKEKVEVESVENKEEDGNEVTMAVLQKWTAALKDQHSLRAMRQVVLAFRAAAHVNEADGKEYKYTISNSDVYHELLVLSLKNIPGTLNHHLPAKESSQGKVRVATDSKKYRTLTPLLKSHIASIHHLLTMLSDAPTIKLTLSSIIPLLPYLLPFKKLLKNLMKTVVTIWSDSTSTEATRITAFLVLRKLAVIGDSGLREEALKAAYQGLVKGSRSTTVHTLQGINLMKNSAAELWGIDPKIGYTTGFTYIRQLAIHLRGSVTNPSKESYKTLYNWQYVHALDFWSRVLSSHCDALREAEVSKQSPLRPLIYPTVQITLGALRLIPIAQYFPLRFQLMRTLLRISLATNTYIPLAPALLEVLTSNEMKKSPKPSTLKPLDFATAIRAPKSYLRTRTYQDGVGAQVAELMAEFFVLWTKSIAFPELALPVTVMLKRWLREVSNKNSGNKNGKVNSALALVVQKIEANGRWIEERRKKVDFAPSDRAGVEGFLKDVEWEKTPLGAYVEGQRKMREDKARLVEESRKDEEERKRREGKGHGDEDRENGGDAVVSDEDIDDDDED